MEIQEHEPTRRIDDLPASIEALPERQRALVERLFHVAATPARLVLSGPIRGWVSEMFGSAAAAEEQRVVRVTNRVSGEEALFNTLRATRPLEVQLVDYDWELQDLLESGRGDPLCRPLEQTPEDVFGRVRGKYCITASNIAKVDAFHGVVIFDEHNPLLFDRERLADYLNTGLAWGQRVLEVDPSAKYWMLWWNALWKSGASILHGHAQVVSTRARHYARAEHLRTVAHGYRTAFKSSYFEDLVAAHDALGLSVHHAGAVLLVSLTPVKEREVWIVDPRGLTDGALDLVSRTLFRFTRWLEVQSFNLAYVRPPLGAPDAAWEHFPHIIRIVDRGSLTTPMADIGGLELYGCASISNDPFTLVAALRDEW